MTKEFDYSIGYHKDKRNHINGINLMKAAIENRSLSIGNLATSRAEEIRYNRFLESEQVTYDGILQAIISNSNKMASGCEHVLSIQDTSELTFVSQLSKKASFGPTGNGLGYFVHPSIIVNPDTEEILGYGDINIWTRDDNHGMYIIQDFSKKEQLERNNLLSNLTSDGVILEPEAKDIYTVYFVRNKKLIQEKRADKTIKYAGKVKKSNEISTNISRFNISLLRKLRAEGKVKKTRNHNYTEEKESYKWIKTAQNTASNLKGIKKITHISDRESDDYAYMSEVMKMPNNHFVLRVTHDRTTTNDEQLSKVISTSKVKSEYELELQRTPKRSARTAKMQLKFGGVEITRPESLKSKREHKDKLSLYYVDVEEISSNYDDSDDKIKWRLYTTHEVTNESQAYDILRMYVLRWLIEMIFTILKSKGFDFENNQLEDYDKTAKLSLIGLNAALIVFYLSNANKYKGVVKITKIFSEGEIKLLNILCRKYEGKTELQKNKYEPHSLQWATWVIMRLGGWKGYDSRGKAGIVAINKGLRKFYLMHEGWSLLE